MFYCKLYLFNPVFGLFRRPRITDVRLYDRVRRYTYKSKNGKPIKIKDLRAHFYQNGFYLDGMHYVRYKRSAGSSREGKCLFIDERLYKAMDKWSSCGLKAQTDLASWESYKALSLSSIKGTIVKL